MDLDALQQQRFIKLRQVKQEIDVATKDLEQFNKAKEKIGEELKELATHKIKQTKQYQKRLVIKQGLEKDIEKIQKNLSKLETQRKDIIKQLDKDILAKTIILNRFKDSKKDFVKDLEVREKAVKQQLNDLLEDNKKLKKEKKEFTDELTVFYKQKTQLRKQRAQIQDKISRNENEIEVNLRKSKEKGREQDKILSAQKAILTKLENQRDDLLKRSAGLKTQEDQLQKRLKSFMQEEKGMARKIAMLAKRQRLFQEQRDIVEGQSKQLKIYQKEMDRDRQEIKDKLSIATQAEQEQTKELSKQESITRVLNSQKKRFNLEIKNQKEETEQIKSTDRILQQQIKILSNTRQKLKEKEKLAENGLILAQKREEVAKNLQVKLSRTQGQTECQAMVTETKLSNIKQIEQETEQELEKQRKATNELRNQNKVLKLKTEAAEKREKPIRRLEDRLKQFEIKLLDDRQALQRAWTELEHKK